MRIILLSALIVLSAVQCDRDTFVYNIKHLDIEALQKLAITSEYLVREKNGKLDKTGGIRDLLSELTIDDLRLILERDVDNYPFLLEKDLLLKKSSAIKVSYEKFLKTLNREELNKFAFAAESYRNKVMKLENLSPVIFPSIQSNLDDSEVIAYILKLVSKHPELGVGTLLEDIVEKGILSDSEFVAFLNSQSRVHLAKLAIAAEQYKKSKLGFVATGGLFDYVLILSKEEIINEIIKFSSNAPELQIKGFLDEIALSKNYYVNDLFLGGFLSYSHNLNLAEIKFIIRAYKYYFNDKYSWLNESNLNVKLRNVYIKAIKGLYNSLSLSEQQNFETKINFPVGGFEYYLSTFETEHLRTKAQRFADLLSIKSKDFNLRYQIEVMSDVELVNFFVQKAEEYNYLINTKFFLGL